jgi:hypothetical protein
VSRLHFGFLNLLRACVLSLLLPTLACTGSHSSIHYSNDWPSGESDYEDVTAAWTRRDVLRAPMAQQKTQLIELYATFLSPEWRHAYVRQQARLRRLNKQARAALEAEQRKADSEFYEVQLVVTTYHHSHNDLHRGENSMWKVALIDQDGKEIPAARVEKDRRPRQQIAAEFPKFGDFAAGYRAYFPKDSDLLAGSHFAMRVSSSLGAVEVFWNRE